MGFFTNKKTGQVFKTRNNGHGTITSPIGTTLHNTDQEDKIRLVTRLTERNKGIKESHEEKIRREKLKRAEFEKAESRRIKQQQEILDDIETRRRLLKQAKKDPSVLDRLSAINPQGGSLPRDFQKNQSEQQKKFFDEESKKLGLIRDSTKQDVERAKDEQEKNRDMISQLHHEAENLRKTSSNIPEINHENTRRINEIQMEIKSLEDLNDTFQDDIDRGVKEIKETDERINRVRGMNKDTAFGTVGDLPDHVALPKGTLESRQRAKESFEARKTGKGTAPIFPEGFEHKRKVRDPHTGKEFFSSRLPKNKRFAGFGSDGDPIFVDKDRPEPEPVQTNIPREVHHEGDPTSHRGESLRVIPGLARTEEE